MGNKPHDVRPENAVVFLANLLQQKCGKRRHSLTPNLHNNDNTMSFINNYVYVRWVSHPQSSRAESRGAPVEIPYFHRLND